MFSVPLWVIPLILIAGLYQIAVLALPRFFLVPTHKWQDKILHVIRYPKPIYLNVGVKRSSYRRRLVTASAQPSFYTNFVNDKLKILPEDAKDEERFMAQMKVRDPNDNKRRLVYGFFHPYANNGGGGEKVLWQAVLATLMEDKRNIVAVYTTNNDTGPLRILRKAEEKFKISNLDSRRIVFIYLRKYAAWIDSSSWKHFTLAGQLLGCVVLGLEAMYELSPDVWIDTMGLPGSYWLVSWILKIPVVAYVHYPIIQPDMFNKLKFRTVGDLAAFNFTLGHAKQLVKFFYWSLLYSVYMYLGSCVDVTLANGTWTYDHISSIWALNKTKVVSIVYPPCSTEEMVRAETAGPSKRQNKLLYIAQFRPEKRHALVLENYLKFVEAFRSSKLPLSDLPTLVFLGSCRTETDSSTLDSLRHQAANLDLTDHIEFLVGCSFAEVKLTLSECTFGLNAMWNEHFGIGVVEYLSAGVVPLVHASAGPLLDIVRESEPSTTWKNEIGYFFKDESDPDFEGETQDGMLQFTIRGNKCSFPNLADLLKTLFIENPEECSQSLLQEKRDLGVKLLLERFSNHKFTETWTNYLRSISQLEAHYRKTRRDKVDAVY
ncbi:GDP-Man:Man(3)GlcNAc(2)-PP-Dol alpha-1,2-mannosyltransferase [Metschnikowia bicuspidata var. bicuspidata NRRL YB-4993]|uniref:GDP-Man:Man(3)GlcNAc(2)-PP-Dol alpha-1,2-mannosyltransferase n=1 Tax=Metschnikowia bicuspidata var. bicuspidata NRRL YB-4993 TaxID=869754 RepID=A0A1A0HD16_9ASCO|nr:GDP-Man:Man(3)GlcNAc(2)-PP-Dol alpha-1,2-mannosyltransferase [Metschnikowia bicuspidata var. bicuspidata NRRL YB-4993]OBA21870.1 GDP-Man:Man(3)GlcNAc(2)-PP-Dol alpha-1,2-mannosyltransferase [Metschnikowia bicuspidata var. bicuspidata NRRL YB-4993]